MTLLAVLSTMAVSCQKDSIDSAMPANVVNNVHSVYIYQYEVNGVRSRITTEVNTIESFLLIECLHLQKKAIKLVSLMKLEPLNFSQKRL